MNSEAPFLLKFIEFGLILSIIGYVFFSLEFNSNPLTDFSSTPISKEQLLLSLTIISFILGYPFFLLLGLIIRIELAIITAIISIIGGITGIGGIGEIANVIEKSANLFLDFLSDINNALLNIIYSLFGGIIDSIFSKFSTAILPMKIGMGVGGLSIIYLIGDFFIESMNLTSLEDLNVLLKSLEQVYINFLNNL